MPQKTLGNARARSTTAVRDRPGGPPIARRKAKLKRFGRRKAEETRGIPPMGARRAGSVKAACRVTGIGV